MTDPQAVERLVLPDELRVRLTQLLSIKSPDFNAMVKAAGLDPARDFRGADLRGVDFTDADLTGFDFSGADLSGAKGLAARESGKIQALSSSETLSKEPSGYKYDIFLSYHRGTVSDDWVNRLVEILTSYVSSYLGREVVIFFDREDVLSSTSTHAALADALRKSRCMVCLWSPRYFSSDWCITEWETFLRREEEVNQKLIIPARIHGGEHFPVRAKEIQMADFSQYFSLASAFWESQLAVEFEKQLKPFSENVAATLQSSPEFSDDFPFIEVPSDYLKVGSSSIGRPSFG